MSMEIVLIILLIVVICGIGVVLFVFLQKFNEIKNTNAVELMKTDVTELSRSIMSLQQTMGDKLEKSNLGVQQSVQKQLTESAKLVADVTQRLARLDETNRRVINVADDLKSLKNVLSHPKQLGVYGEIDGSRVCWRMSYRRGSFRHSINLTTGKLLMQLSF